MHKTCTKAKVVYISSIGILNCSPSTQREVRAYSEKTGIPIARIVDDAMNDWLTCVGSVRLAAAECSQFEKKILGRP